MRSSFFVFLGCFLPEKYVAELLDLSDFGDKEDALSLALCCWLDNPFFVGVAVVVVHEDGVILRQDVGLRDDF